eukprot:4318616-Pyramimonas_sp.AAC.1
MSRTLSCRASVRALVVPISHQYGQRVAFTNRHHVITNTIISTTLSFYALAYIIAYIIALATHINNTCSLVMVVVLVSNIPT